MDLLCDHFIESLGNDTKVIFVVLKSILILQENIFYPFAMTNWWLDAWLSEPKAVHIQVHNPIFLSFFPNKHYLNGLK